MSDSVTPSSRLQLEPVPVSQVYHMSISNSCFAKDFRTSSGNILPRINSYPARNMDQSFETLLYHGLPQLASLFLELLLL